MSVLYLIRHAIAADAEAGETDEERELTKDGAEKMRSALEGLKRLDIQPDAILTSALVRAEQTAKLTAEALAPSVEVTVFAPLAPGNSPEDAVRGLARVKRAQAVALVGHQPGLGELASYLLTGSPTLAPLPFKKGGVAAIEVDALPPRRPGVLLWFMTPKQMRAIAGCD